MFTVCATNRAILPVLWRTPELVATLASITILSEHEFGFDGGTRVADPVQSVSNAGDVLPGAGSHAGLTQSIRDALYEGCYANRLGETRPSAMGGDATAFAQCLDRANAGRERWDAGWVIQRFALNGQPVVRKGELERIAVPGSFISPVTQGMVPRLGDAVVLRAPAGALGLQPGYYFAFGETLDELADQSALVRFYFHCLAADAEALMRMSTKMLNRFQIPFQMKLPSAPALYGRTDGGVLYVGARFIPIALRVIEAVRIAVPLAPSVPLFAKPLWSGIAAAVDPGTGESFGLHRCRLVAEGIVQSWSEGRTDLPGWLAAVTARFSAAGLDIARPWLGPGWMDLFHVPMTPAA